MPARQARQSQPYHAFVFFGVFELPELDYGSLGIFWREPGRLAFFFLRRLHAHHQKEKSGNMVLCTCIPGGLFEMEKSGQPLMQNLTGYPSLFKSFPLGSLPGFFTGLDAAFGEDPSASMRPYQKDFNGSILPPVANRRRLLKSRQI